MRLHVADHPLISHKLTVLRDEKTPQATFRLLVDELVTLLAYEATREVRTEQREVVTPVATTIGTHMADPKPIVVPILRAGLGMLAGMMRLLPKLDADPELRTNPKKAKLLLFGIIKNLSRNLARHESVVEANEPEIGREMEDDRSRAHEPGFHMEVTQLQGLLFTWMTERLTSDEEAILTMQFLDGMTIANIAKEFGEDSKRISNKRDKALRKLEKVPELRAFFDQWKGDR